MKAINNELLFKYVEENGLSYTEIASEAMISKGTLYNILLRRNHPSYLITNILANYLELTKEEFVEIFFPAVKFREE